MEERIEIIIKKVHDQIEKHINKQLKENGLTMSQGKVIAYLNDNKDHEVTQKEIEKNFEISHVTLSGIITRLENNHFIKVDRSQRTNKIYLLDKGMNNENKIKENQKELEDRLFKCFTEEEKKEFIRDFSKIYNNLKEE